MQELQLFAWQSEARGNDIHLNANPTQGELLHQAYREKKEELRDTSKVSVLAKYGGEEHLAKPAKELLLGQTEEYVEYSRAGQVIHGKERAATRSKYPEDGSFPRLCLICYSSPTCFISLRQQSYVCVGIVVRYRVKYMGLCVLPLHRAHLILHWRGWKGGSRGVERAESAHGKRTRPRGFDIEVSP